MPQVIEQSLFLLFTQTLMLSGEDGSTQPSFSSSRYGHNSCPKLEHDFCLAGIPQIQYMQSIYMLGTRYLLFPITFYLFEGSQPLSGPAALFPPFL